MIDKKKHKQRSISDPAEYYTNPAGTVQRQRVTNAKSSQNVPRIVEGGKVVGRFNSSGSLLASVEYKEQYRNVPLVEVSVVLFNDVIWKLPLRDGLGGVGLVENITTSGFTVRLITNPVAQPYANTDARILYRVWSLDV